MPGRRRVIRAPAKILVGLRFRNRCMGCGRVIPQGKMFCPICSRKRKIL